MGCDIHVYLEHRRKGSGHNFESFGGRINPGRDYRVFARVAGVRNYDNVKPITPLRGIAQDMSWNTASDFWCYVTEEGEGDDVSRARAEQWVGDGVSVWQDDERRRASNPDWHSRTWLTADEVEIICQEFDYADEWFAIHAVLKSFEERGNEARAVIWFDN